VNDSDEESYLLALDTALGAGLSVLGAGLRPAETADRSLPNGFMDSLSPSHAPMS